MDIAKLKDEINRLTAASSNLNEPDKSFSLNKIDMLGMQIDGLALSELKDKLAQISLPDLDELKTLTNAANDATKDHASRVNAINSSVNILKSVLEIAL